MSLKVLNRQYKVEEVDAVDSHNCWGECSNIKQVISVRKGQSAECYDDTLLHEALHAALDQGTLIDHLHAIDNKDELEEAICKSITGMVIQILTENYEHFHFMCEDE